MAAWFPSVAHEGSQKHTSRVLNSKGSACVNCAAKTNSSEIAVAIKF